MRQSTWAWARPTGQQGRQFLQPEGREAGQGGADEGQGQDVGDPAAKIAGRLDQAHGARPAQLVRQQIAGVPFREHMVDQHGRRGDGQALRPHGRAQHEIVRQLIGQHLEAARRLQGPRPQRHGGAQAGMRAQGLAHRHARGEARVDVQGRQLRPEARGRPAAIEAVGQAHARLLQRAHDARQAAQRQAHVAVADDENLAPGVGGHVDQVAELAVGPMLGRVGRHPDIHVRVFLMDPARYRQGRIGHVARAQDQLHRPGVVLGEQAEKVLVELGLLAVQGLQHCHGGTVPRLGAGPTG